MKLGPVTKPDKRNTTTSKHLTMTSCWQIVTSLSFFQFMANLQSFGKWIPDAWSIKLAFSLSSLFIFQNLKTELKILTQLSNYFFEYRYYFWQKILIFCEKNIDISKINRVLELKDTFSETRYVCVLTYQFQASSIILTSFRQGIILNPHHRKTDP